VKSKSGSVLDRPTGVTQVQATRGGGGKERALTHAESLGIRLYPTREQKQGKEGRFKRMQRGGGEAVQGSNPCIKKRNDKKLHRVEGELGPRLRPGPFV